MSNPVSLKLLVLMSATSLMVAAPADAQVSRRGPKAKVTLVPSVEAVVGGKAFDVALHFQLDEGWHIYWINSGEAGLPPRVSWTLPEGFRVGRLRFPTPKRHTDPGNITTNILAGKPVLLASLTPPDSMEPGEITVKADVTYLICDKLCLRESATLTLTLPVRKTGEPKPANAELFARARRAMPKVKAKFVSVTPSIAAINLTPGKTFELSLAINIAKRYHIQSHEPLMDMFIRTDVFLEPTPGIIFGKPIYPKAHLRTLPVLGTVSEYSGKIAVRIPVEVDDEPPTMPLHLRGILTYQGCNDKGTCFPPDALQFELVQNAEPGRTAASTPPPVEAVEQMGSTAGVESAVSDDTETFIAADGDQLAGFLARFGLVGLMAGCFLYGLILNATPCVLPLLSIKVLGFVQQARESRRRTLLLALAFGAGVITFFVVLGFLAASGKNVLQYPAAVIALGAVVMALALSMLGVYTLTVPTAATRLDASIQKEGVFSSFGKGALAPVLGFACTGPLLAGAWGWATQQEPWIAIFAFLCGGLGMASPYVLLGANPKWLSFLPKPGNWMITFERIMGFMLLGMVVWLLHPLIHHIGAEGLEWTLIFLVALAMACWLLGKVDITMPLALRWRYRGGATALALGSGLIVFGWIYPLDEAIARQQDAQATSGPHGPAAGGKIAWQRWSDDAVKEAVRAGKTVFVDFTAAYCTVCKVNKKVAIYRTETLAKMDKLGIVAFQADFTSGAPEVFAALKRHGRAGTPLNLVYRPCAPDKPIVLRPSLSLSYLLEKLDEAGASRAACSGA